jgi:putative spermidine/putrescine transport system permease protein
MAERWRGVRARGLRVTAGAVSAPRARRPGDRVAELLWRRPWARATGVLSAPLAWFLLVYVASLIVLLITAFWQVNPFTNQIEHVWSLNNFRTFLGNAAYREIIGRTIGMAAAETVTDALVAFPFAFFMARVAGPRLRTALLAAIMLPLWTSYLARVYAWLLILSHRGALNWTLHQLHLPGVQLAYTNWAMWIVFSYIWLPFMITPMYVAMERIPDSYLEASADLGAHGWRTLRKVIMPLALPGMVAGSIFTFALTLGDYITPLLVGGAGSSFIGNVVYTNVGIAGNLPFAAAFALVPIAVMAVYLAVAKRLGAFEAL